MKNLIIPILILLIGTSVGNAQDSLPKKKMVLNAQVYSNKRMIANHYLIEVEDTSLSLSPSRSAFQFTPADTSKLISISYREIDYIKISKPHTLTKAVFLGGFIGFAVGAILSVEVDKSYGGSTSALGPGIMVFGIAGCLIGGFIGSSYVKKFTINRKETALKALREGERDKAVS